MKELWESQFLLLLKYCPKQFEIIGAFNHGKDGPWDFATATVDGVEKYKRLAIRKKQN